MTKQFTTEEIIKALQDYYSMDFMIGSTGEVIYYFIHLDLDSLELVSGCGLNVEDFNSEYYGLIDEENEDFSWESAENEDFVNVAEELKNQVNEFIKSL